MNFISEIESNLNAPKLSFINARLYDSPSFTKISSIFSLVIEHINSFSFIKQLSKITILNSPPYNSNNSLLYESILNIKLYESIPFSIFISCLSEYKKGTIPFTLFIFINPASDIIVILYSLYSKVALVIFLIYSVLEFKFSCNLQNILILSLRGFHSLQVTSYLLFNWSVNAVSNSVFSSISEILNILYSLSL